MAIKDSGPICYDDALTCAHYEAAKDNGLPLTVKEQRQLAKWQRALESMTLAEQQAQWDETTYTSMLETAWQNFDDPRTVADWMRDH